MARESGKAKDLERVESEVERNTKRVQVALDHLKDQVGERAEKVQHAKQRLDGFVDRVKQPGRRIRRFTNEKSRALQHQVQGLRQKMRTQLHDEPVLSSGTVFLVSSVVGYFVSERIFPSQQLNQDLGEML